MKIGHLREGGRAMMLVYEATDFEDEEALSSELEEVWTELRSTAEKEGDVRRVSITVQSPPRGLLSRREAASFSIQRNSDGTWGRP